MILRIYSVYDGAVQAYMPPFFERANGAALRAFQNAVQDEKHVFSKRPADYQLMILGEFDDATGYVERLGPELLARAVDLVLPQA